MVNLSSFICVSVLFLSFNLTKVAIMKLVPMIRFRGCFYRKIIWKYIKGKEIESFSLCKFIFFRLHVHVNFCHSTKQKCQALYNMLIILKYDYVCIGFACLLWVLGIQVKMFVPYDSLIRRLRECVCGFEKKRGR